MAWRGKLEATPGQVALAWILKRSPGDAAHPRHQQAAASDRECSRRFPPTVGRGFRGPGTSGRAPAAAVNKRLFGGNSGRGSSAPAPAFTHSTISLAPGIAKRPWFIAVELLPVMILPQQGGTALHSGIEDGLMGLAIADQNPDSRLTARHPAQTARALRHPVWGCGRVLAALKIPRCRLPIWLSLAVLVEKIARPETMRWKTAPLGRWSSCHPKTSA